MEHRWNDEAQHERPPYQQAGYSVVPRLLQGTPVPCVEPNYHVVGMRTVAGRYMRVT